MKKKFTAPMAAPGKLIALDGARTTDLLAEAKRLLREQSPPARRGGVSQWDASQLFYQLSRNSELLDYPSPKTLVVLYAADLAFRLRWEIEPLRAEGKDVVAAPYVETAMGFGLAAGLDAEWLKMLFNFAPPAYATYRLSNAASLGKGVKASGFVDHCLRTLAARPDPWKRPGVTRHFGEYLNQWGTAPHR